MAEITKGVIGEQDFNKWDGVTGTFTRDTSTGGTLTLNKVGTEIDILSVYGAGVNYTDATIISALTAIGTTNKVAIVLRPGTWTVSASRNWSAYTNVTFKLSPGALISHGAYTLNIPNPEAGPYQWLTGAGAVTFTNAQITYPQWEGGSATAGPVLDKALNISAATAALARAALSVEYIRTNANVLDPTYGAVGDGSDDLVAIQAAVSAADVIYFPYTAGGYGISDKIVMTTRKKLVGDGKFVSTLKALTNSQTMLSLVYGTDTRAYVEVSNLGLNANGKTAVKGIGTTLASAVTFKDLFFAGVDYTFFCDRGNTIIVNNIINEGTAALLAGRAQFYDSTNASYLQHLTIDKYETRNIGNGVQTPSLLLYRVAPGHIRSFNANDLTTGSSADGIAIWGDCQGILVENSIIVKPYKGVEAKTWVGTTPSFITFSSVDIDQPQLVAYQLTNAINTHITGGNLTNGAGNAINVATNSVSIDGLEVDTLAGNGIVVDAGVSYFKIINNRIYNVTGGAIIVSTGASDYYRISGNDCSIGNGSKISDSGTGVNKFLSENL